MSLDLSRADSAIARSEQPFHSKVRAIHDTWSEARLTSEARRSKNRDAQATLLVYLYEYCVGMVAAMGDFYEAEVVRLSSPPASTDDPAQFELRIGDECLLAAALLPLDESAWHVSIRLRYPGEPQFVSAQWHRRNDNWTRQRIEELVLSLLSAFERARSPMAGR